MQAKYSLHCHVSAAFADQESSISIGEENLPKNEV